MTLKEYREHFIFTLHSRYESMEAKTIFDRLLEDLYQIQAIEMALNPDLSVPLEKLNTALDRLQKGEPYQHIVGKETFLGLDFEVNSDVLIPRPETEELVQWILQDFQGKKNLKILDLCTGSGCIAISLAKNLPNASVSALDYSKKALKVAKRNAEKHEVQLTWLEENLLNLESLSTDFDLIVSNPPYVRELEKMEIKSNVLDHEPHMALFVPDEDALLFYRKICELSKGKPLYLEINQYLGPQTKLLMESFGYQNVTLKKDFRGNDRMIKGL